MTLKSLGFEGTTSGATWTATNGGTGDAALTAGTMAGAGAAIATYSTDAMHGTRSLDVNGISGDQFRAYATDTSALSCAWTVYFKWVSGSGAFVYVVNSAGTPIPVQLAITTTSKLAIAGKWTSTTTLAANTWYRHEGELIVDTATTGTLRSRLYSGDSSTPLETAYSANNVDNGTVTVGRFQIGKNTSTPDLRIKLDSILFNIGSSTATGKWPVPATTAPQAGSDQSDVEPYSTVTLNGVAGTGPAPTWSQTGGPTVVLGGSGLVRTFTAPATRAGTTLTFTLSDGTLSDTMTVAVATHNQFYVATDGTEKPARWLPASDFTGSIATVPGVPTSVARTPAATSVIVGWQPPTSDGGSAVTGYTITWGVGNDIYSDTYNPSTASVASTARSYSITGLASGTAYTVTVAAVNSAGTGAASSASVTTTSSVVPLVGKSALPWNSIVFGHGASTGLAAFETWRNRPVDGSMYWPARQTWTDMGNLPSRRTGDLVVYAIPPYPEGLAGGSNANVASGLYDADIKAWAQRLITAGWNTRYTCIRLAWENNLTSYPWSWTSTTYTTFIAAYQRFVTQSRAQGLTNVLWNWNLNKGPSGGNNTVNWSVAYPGDDYVDVIGIDPYDWYTVSTNETSWTQNTTGKNPGLEDIAAFCRTRGKLMSIDEWGCTLASANGGGDNPWYVTRMMTWLKANASIIAWDSTYDYQSSLTYAISGSSIPNASAAYKAAYPAGWGA